MSQYSSLSLPPSARLSHTTEALTPRRIKRELYSYKEMLFFILQSPYNIDSKSDALQETYEIHTSNDENKNFVIVYIEAAADRVHANQI